MNNDLKAELQRRIMENKRQMEVQANNLTKRLSAIKLADTNQAYGIALGKVVAYQQCLELLAEEEKAAKEFFDAYSVCSICDDMGCSHCKRNKTNTGRRHE